MKGQVGNLTGFAYALMMVGIIMGVGLVVLTSFQQYGTPNQVKTVTNSTATVSELIYPTQQDILIQSGIAGEFGEYRNGTLSLTLNGTSATTANTTVTLNGVSVGQAGGYNTTGVKVIKVTASQLANGLNNVSYQMSNTSDVTSTSITFEYTRQGDVQARSTIDSVTGSFTTLSAWLPIIVVIVAVAIVLGLLGFGFGTAGKKKGR